MELHEYPRPEDDTGIGIHWVTGYPTAVGVSRIREYWLPELKALGVKWVKLPNHDGAQDLVELLLAEGIMPIVRLFRPDPNPGRLGVRELVYVDSLVRAGARYFEFNNEPDSDAEWKGGRRPHGAVKVVAEDTIANIEMILERGGMPSIPALSGGSDWDLVGTIVQLGRRDLFDGPVWQAIHNYPRNRPLDYPYDIGNQEGAAFTERFYQVVAEENWGDSAWRGRTLYEVNRLRLGRANPGASIDSDHDCWLAYNHFDALNQHHLGRSIPILSTACGYIVGEDTDPRYPAVTPDLHMAQTLEGCRIMMGTSRRFEQAPEFFFCTAFWLIANRQLGSSSDWWEGHSWYSDRWPNGALPIVRALRAEPKTARRRDAPPDRTTITVRGTVYHAADRRRLTLEQDSVEVAQARLDGDDRFVFVDVVPGSYRVRVADTDIIQELNLTAEQQNVFLNFDLSRERASISNSIIRGTVRGGAGAVVMVVRAADGEEWVTLAREDGAYRFVDLPAGVYSVRVHPFGSRIEAVELNGRDEHRIDLSVFGWGYTVHYRGDDPKAHAGAVRCTVDGHSGVEITLEGTDRHHERLTTGSNPEYGSYTCEFSGIAVGDYLVTALEVPHGESGMIDLEARVSVDHKRVPEVLFVHSEADPGEERQQSQIVGTLLGLDAYSRHGVLSAHSPDSTNPGARPSVILIDGQAKQRLCRVDEGGRFSFDGLRAGVYAVTIAGFDDETRQADIALDGMNTVELDLRLPADVVADEDRRASGNGVISGYVPDATGALATIVDATGNEFARIVGQDGRFQFENLAAGLYTLTVEGGYRQPDIIVDRSDSVEIVFSPLAPSWAAEISSGGAMPGFSLLRVDVEGKHGHPVSVWREDGEPLTGTTGVEGAPTVAEFGPLEVGEYLVEPQGLDVRAKVELTGLEVMWVTFRQVQSPLNPNLVRRIHCKTPHAQTSGDQPVGSSIYLYVGRGLFTAQELQRVVEYASGSQVSIGSDVEQAQHAARVALIGDVDEEVFARLDKADVDLLTWPWPSIGPSQDQVSVSNPDS